MRANLAWMKLAVMTKTVAALRRTRSSGFPEAQVSGVRRPLAPTDVLDLSIPEGRRPWHGLRLNGPLTSQRK